MSELVIQHTCMDINVKLRTLRRHRHPHSFAFFYVHSIPRITSTLPNPMIFTNWRRNLNRNTSDFELYMYVFAVVWCVAPWACKMKYSISSKFLLMLTFLLWFLWPRASWCYQIDGTFQIHLSSSGLYFVDAVNTTDILSDLRHKSPCGETAGGRQLSATNSSVHLTPRVYTALCGLVK